MTVNITDDDGVSPRHEMSFSKVRVDELDGLPVFFKNGFRINVTLSDEDATHTSAHLDGKLLVVDFACSVRGNN